MRLAAALAPLLFAACVGGPVRSKPPPVEPAAVLTVATFTAQGTAFVVEGAPEAPRSGARGVTESVTPRDRVRRRILTAWHVVEGSSGGAIVSGGGTVRPVLFRRVGESDLAEADPPVPLPATWAVYAVAEAHDGDRLDAVGMQEGVLLHFRGRVSRIFAGEGSALGEPGRYVEVDCGVVRGMSGGPLLDQRGDVVAVVTNRLAGRLVALDIP